MRICHKKEKLKKITRIAIAERIKLRLKVMLSFYGIIAKANQIAEALTFRGRCFFVIFLPSIYVLFSGK